MRRSLLLSCLCLMALVGCHHSPPPTMEQVRVEWTAKANKVIPDVARAKQVGDMGAKLVEDQRAMAEEMNALGNQMAALNADYNSSPEQFKKMVNEFEAKQQAAHTNYKDGVFAIRKLVSAEEWKELNK